MPPPAFDPAELRTSLGDTIEARFELGSSVAAGPSTDLVTARDRELGRIVAAKIVRDDAPESEVKRILVEAQVAAQLTHPNVVPLYSLEVTADGKPTFTMQRVRGETLAVFVERCAEARDPKEGQYSLRRRMEIFLGVCDAIAYAHTRGVYHRNLGPGSVMLGPFAEVFVTDWGFALLGDRAHATPVELTVAPPSMHGMPREAVSAPAVRSAHDLEAERRDRRGLGLLLDELIRLAPRVGNDPAPASATRSRRRVPKGLQAIADAAMKDALYRDVRAIADDVRRHLRGESAQARPDTASTRLARRVMRRPELLSAALLLLVVAAGGFALVKRVRALDGQTELSARQAALARVSGSVTARADRLDGIANEIATELYGARASLSLVPTSTAVDQALRGLTRRTGALRAFVVQGGAARVIGAVTPDLARLTPRGTADARWGDPLKRAPHEPWVVPLVADLTRPDGRASGVIGVDVPLATLAVLTSMTSSEGLRSLRIVDGRGRGLDAQGYLTTPPDPGLQALIDARVESDLLLRDGLSLALARVHTLGWYMVGDAEDTP